MKPMKKTLAAALAVSMMFSTLCLASAAYTDQDHINQTQAVQHLTDLGILNGKSDGSFDPGGQLTRGEMAKMIYVLNTGSSNASAYESQSTTFQDIATTWASPYIKYAVKENILAGRSATIFDPDASVTGLEEAKMLLVYLGCDPAKNGLTGSDWAANTKTLGEKNGLFISLTADLTQAICREDAAQMMYNAIQAKNQEKPSNPPSSDSDDWDSGKLTRGDNNYLAGMVVNCYIAQNSDNDKLVYLDLLTADGKKRAVETDLSSTSAGATRLRAGSLISFWGSSYKAVEDLSSYNFETRLSETRNYAAIKSYNQSTGRVSFYNGLYNGSTKTNFTAAKIVSDTLVIYVDQSNSDPEKWKVLQDGSLTEAFQADAEGSYTANCFVSLQEDDPSKIDLLVVEVSQEILDDSQHTVILTATAQ